VHLNEEGRAQVQALARRLGSLPLAAIYSSPLERTLETAQPLAEVQGLVVEVREDLGETRYGDWTGRALKELREEDLWPVVQVYPGGARFPGGESMREVQARMVAELDAIRDAHPGETVAVVSHSDPIKMAVAHYLGLPLDLFQRLTISPASVTAFSFTRFGPRLVCLNATETLPSFKVEKEEGNEEH
jgi:probable phosphoglycerate mutase